MSIPLGVGPLRSSGCGWSRRKFVVIRMLAVVAIALTLGVSLLVGLSDRRGTHKPSGHLSYGGSSQFKLASPPPFFGIDIDGTFYTENEDSWRRNIEAFAKVKKMGHTPFFCTGRARNTALRIVGDGFVKTTGYNGFPGVYKNGAIVYDRHGVVLSLHAFPESFLKTLHSFLTAENLLANAIFYTEDDAFSLVENNEVVKHLIPGRYTVPTLVSFEDLMTKNILVIKYSDFKFDIPGLEEGVDYVDKADTTPTRDLTPPKVTKKNGVITLLEHYSVPPENCGYVGDGDNDVEVMELCRISFAVANAKDEIKKHAKRVLDKTCDEGAVAEALELTYGPFSP